MHPTLLYIYFKGVIPAKAGIQIRNTGFPRIKYGAGLVKPGMAINGKRFMMHYINSVFINHGEVFNLFLSWNNSSMAIRPMPMVMAESAILKAGQWYEKR